MLQNAECVHDHVDTGYDGHRGGFYVHHHGVLAIKRLIQMTHFSPSTS
ncbi:hypothetical protein THF1C08_200096 [Vibrio jasicida]|jgi:hypothetical protein|uniref:Uncharacterized protein n=1 Tax=Vibrio jasicida TaxID=766224 RepID=A0AAU9QKS7_9VIBR|nr:hypothetical protein THF1C08_200096 [Vibrio jasicida]CAH1589221.1 hypothetical protein THF1A12_210018 [Vibrio jasicida]